MYSAKTQSQDFDMGLYLASIPPDRVACAQQLIEIFSAVTGYPARLWAGRMVGFGRYEYRYDSGHGGQSLATGFAMGRGEISLYILPGLGDYAGILRDLGPHRIGKSCLYLRALRPEDLPVLRRLIRAGLDDLAQRWDVQAE